MLMIQACDDYISAKTLSKRVHLFPQIVQHSNRNNLILASGDITHRHQKSSRTSLNVLLWSRIYDCQCRQSQEHC
ncbi:LOW QUALITY PROTEIN: hypothetical protein NC652_010910 [Populus alba x Populus x berolinensis]|nr:LOW QUALITY PROTEIN: hypothetical protein NC652_010910 [Populus alba x Populus x berolinensis]